MTRLHRTFAATIGLAAGVLVSSCAPPLDTRVVAVAASAREADLERRILEQVTVYRGTRGHAALRRNPALDQMARQHSEFLRSNRGKFQVHGPNVSHYGIEQRAFAAKQFLGMNQLGENVAAASQQGAATASYLVGLWAKSPTHEFNMCNSWTNTGVGVVIDTDGMVFATQVFASQSLPNSHLTLINSLRVH